MAYHVPEAFRQNFEKIAHQAGATAATHMTHAGKFTVKFGEGFTYSSFNPRGNPTVWSIMKVCELSRCIGSWGGARLWGFDHLDMDRIDKMLYVVSLRLTCEPELYDPGVDKQPVEVDTELVHVGNTSYKIRNHMRFPKMHKPVAKKDIGIVFVDKETRRPSAPPEWWKEKYLPYSRPDERALAFKPFDFSLVREKGYEVHFVVRSSDLDPYCHLNNTSYVRFCYEAYVSQHVRQFGFTGRGDPFRNVRTVACMFKGEAGLGDLLKVFFVQDPSDEDSYHFKISKDSEAVIFECHFQFFPQVLSKY